MKILPIFNLYEKPYICNGLEVSSYEEAAKYMADCVVDNALEFFTDEKMKNSEAVKKWYENMPNATPEVINRYQNENCKSDLKEVSDEINKIRCRFSETQQVIHAGNLPEKNFITKRPLSATLDMQVAFREAEFCGKAYNDNEINIYELTVKDSKTSVFVTNPESEHGNEKEVIFSAGATIEILTKKTIKKNYKVFSTDGKKIKIGSYKLYKSNNFIKNTEFFNCHFFSGHNL